ncbi:hypothetical protein CEXT_140911 [Caerostris extrusa]|uniref:Uncharacterized protein n=1 Tax=Caerostris extrusa TaxID=172846 RepID=A0AAV4U4J5_CAEEX|nr:hypothetical protein CEXT_140911 [Caerostris extrusa]
MKLLQQKKAEKPQVLGCLVRQLLDVSCNSSVEQMQRRKEIRVPWGTGIVGHVAECRESLNIPDCYTSIGETGFLVDAELKSKYRAKLNLIKEMRVAMSSLIPRFKKMCSDLRKMCSDFQTHPFI